MADRQSTSEAWRSAGVIGRGQMGRGIALVRLDKAVENGMAKEDFTRLYHRIDELLEAEARKRSGA